MKNPNGSDIPGARKLLWEILNGEHGAADDDVLDTIREALDRMVRQTPVRQAFVQQRVPITSEMKARVFALKADRSLSNADIAVLVGLPKCGSGRVSEILQGLR